MTLSDLQPTTSPCSCDLCSAAAKLREQPDIASVIAEIDVMLPDGRLTEPLLKPTIFPDFSDHLFEPLRQAGDQLGDLVARANTRALHVGAYGTVKAGRALGDVVSSIDEMQPHPWYLALTMPGLCQHAAQAKAEAERFDPFLVAGELEDGEIPF